MSEPVYRPGYDIEGNPVKPKMQLVHWPECTNNPCTCGERGDVLFSNTPQLTPNPDGAWPVRHISLDEFRAQYEMNKHPSIDYGKVICLDCGWQGVGSQLKAQACPVCDGRCADC